ncbi:MAG: hypothetical protein V7L31_30405 [Nostoc sp.]
MYVVNSMRIEPQRRRGQGGRVKKERSPFEVTIDGEASGSDSSNT